MKLFSIHDAKAEFHQNPFFARTKEEAKRLFAQAVNDTAPNNQFNQSPADFTLFEVGNFDEVSGELTPLPKTSLGNGLEFKKPE